MTSINHLFPITIEITQKMIDKSIPTSFDLCQGAIALRYALGKFANGRSIRWGFTVGMIDGEPITTVGNLPIPIIMSPTKVTFTLLNQ